MFVFNMKRPKGREYYCINSYTSLHNDTLEPFVVLDGNGFCTRYKDGKQIIG